MIWTDDPVRDAADYYDEKQRRAAELPICECCGCRITDDYYWEPIARECYCEQCAKKLFRKITPDV